MSRWFLLAMVAAVAAGCTSSSSPDINACDVDEKSGIATCKFESCERYSFDQKPWACSPDGTKCYWFVDACLPDGWVRTQPGDAAIADAPSVH